MLIYCVILPLQIYERFDADSVVDSDDARFEYFTTKVRLNNYHVFCSLSNEWIGRKNFSQPVSS